MNKRAIPVPELSFDHRDEEIAGAVRKAYAAACPASLVSHIRAEVRAQEQAVRAWQARWLFAVPVLELALIVVLRSDTAPMLTAAGRVLASASESAIPSWQGGLAVMQSWWESTATLAGVDLAKATDALPWALAALSAAALSAAVIIKQESANA